VEMQQRLAELDVKWRNHGIEKPFRARMGINTGYCNVGNFGSSERMDYTIIGGEANLAARLQSSADVGRIVLSYETWALVKDIVCAHPLPAVAMKGIGREVVPYQVEGLIDNAVEKPLVREEMPGLSLYFDPQAVQTGGADRARTILKSALSALEVRSP